MRNKRKMSKERKQGRRERKTERKKQRQIEIKCGWKTRKKEIEKKERTKIRN